MCISRVCVQLVECWCAPLPRLYRIKADKQHMNNIIKERRKKKKMERGGIAPQSGSQSVSLFVSFRFETMFRLIKSYASSPHWYTHIHDDSVHAYSIELSHSMNSTSIYVCTRLLMRCYLVAFTRMRSSYTELTVLCIFFFFYAIIFGGNGGKMREIAKFYIYIVY